MPAPRYPSLLLVVFAWLPWAADVFASTNTTAPTVTIEAEAPTMPALRDELLAMTQADQAIRNRLIESNFQDEDAKREMAEVDARHTARMKAIIATHGWPRRSQVGKEGAGAAWLLVQHADADPDFQNECLALMEPLVAIHEASGSHFAYLTDRVLRAQDKPQRYGPQMQKIGDTWQPQPVEDPDTLDQRRAAAGLPTMAEYRAAMATMYDKPAR